MGLPTLVNQLVDAKLGKYCDNKVPEHIRDQLKIIYKVKGNSVTISEARPFFMDPKKTAETPVAQFRYDKTTCGRSTVPTGTAKGVCRMRQAITFLTMLIGSLLFAHCEGDEEAESEKVCKQLEAKLEECRLTFDSPTGCDVESDDEICAAQCVLDAPCEQIADPKTDSALFLCNAACYGAGPHA